VDDRERYMWKAIFTNGEILGQKLAGHEEG